jgi:hypothetical protein
MAHLPCDRMCLDSRRVAGSGHVGMVGVIRPKSVNRYAAFVRTALGRDSWKLLTE